MIKITEDNITDICMGIGGEMADWLIARFNGRYEYPGDADAEFCLLTAMSKTICAISLSASNPDRTLVYVLKMAHDLMEIELSSREEEGSDER